MEKYLEAANKIINLLILIIFICIALPSSAKEIRLNGKIVTWSNLVAVLNGEHLHAILVAYSDFSKEVNSIALSKEEKESGAGNFPAYVLDINNYDIHIKEGNEGYTIIFQLRLSDKFHLILGNGGITRYVVDRKNFKLLEIDKQK